jgi:hypothetical protein
MSQVVIAEDNLTLLEGVVRAHRDPFAPLAGHVVVTFEKLGNGGERFAFDLREGDTAPPPRPSFRRWLGDRDQYFAFAVTAEWQRRTSVTRTVTMDIALHTLPVTIDLVYSIADPRMLVTRRATDPLRKVREEAASLIGPQLSQREWTRVRKDFRGLEREVVAAVLPRLQRFASDYGILAQEIALTQNLTEKDFGDIAKLEEAEHQKLEDKLKFERDLRIDVHEHDREQSKLARAVADNDTKVAVDNFARHSAVADAAARALVSAIEQAATAVHSPTQLAQAVATIRDAIDELRNVGTRGTGSAQIAGGSAVAALPPATQSGAANVIAELFTETEQMSWASLPIKQGMRGATLHLIAELMMPNATDDAIAEYRDRLSDARAEAALPLDQSDYFRKYIDSDQLRRRLN